MKNKSIHIWVAGVTQTGGIQILADSFIRACAQASGDALAIFSKHDQTQDLNARYPRLLNFGFGDSHHSFRTLFFVIGTAWAVLWKKPEVLICGHAHFLPLAVFFKMFFKLRVAVMVYGIEVWNLSSFQKKILVQTDWILSISRFTQNKIQEQVKIPDERFFILPCTTDERKFYLKPLALTELRQYLKIKPEFKILLSVSRLAQSERYKGHDFVLSTIPEILKKHPNLCYVVVGDGDDRPRLEALVESLGIQENIRFAGRVKDEILPLFYQGCDVFVLPSRGEGFGIVYLEALFCGKPVIASNADAAAEVLLQGKLGRLIAPDDKNQLVQAIHDSLTQSMSEDFLRQKAIEIYGHEKFLKNVKLFFETRLKNLCAV